MTRTEAARPPFFAATLAAAAILLAAATAAHACPPEIMFDPVTGEALGQAELEAALAEVSKTVELAEADR